MNQDDIIRMAVKCQLLTTANRDGVYMEALERFANLIVQECVKEIHEADLGDLFGRDQYLNKISEHIENHFGIEK
jgi:hypothetical protein